MKSNRQFKLALTVVAIAIATVGPKASAQSCHPSYRGACLPPNGPDVDCAGGRGNGPNYVKGPIEVVGPDPFGLDRDGDGIVCKKK